MDTLRGSAILLLLCWHSSSIPFYYYGVRMPEWLFLFNEVFLPWRMPTLMFMSGMLLHRSLSKPLGTYYAGKARSLLWPYVVWGGLHILTWPGFLAAHHDDFLALATPSYIWFLAYLILFYLTGPLVAKLPWWVTLPAILLATRITVSYEIQDLDYYALFFFAGHYARPLMGRVAQARGWPVALGWIAVAAFTAVSLWKTHQIGQHYFQSRDIAIPAVLVLIAATANLASRVTDTVGESAVVRFIQWVGRKSIVFYVVHFPVMRLVADPLADRLGVWVIPVCYVVALSVGIILALGSDKMPLSLLFRAPSRSKRDRA